MSLYSQRPRTNQVFFSGAHQPFSRRILRTECLCTASQRGGEHGIFLPGKTPQLLRYRRIQWSAARSTATRSFITRRRTRTAKCLSVHRAVRSRRLESPGESPGLHFRPTTHALSCDQLRARLRWSASPCELRTKTITSDLDAAPNWNTLAISADGRSAFIALASAGAPDNAARRPDAIAGSQFGVDLATGRVCRWFQLRRR